MFSDMKKLIKHSSIYGLGMIFSKMVGFLMIPFYTHFLTPQDYGVLELLDLAVSLIGMFVGMGIGAAIFRYYYAYEGSEREEVFSTALLFVFFVSIIVFAIVLLSTRELSELIFDSREYGKYIFWMMISAFFSILSSVPEAYVQARQSSVLFTTVNLITLLVNLTLNIWVVAFLKMGVMGLVYVSALMRCLNTVSWLLITVPRAGLRFSKKKLKEMLEYGLPLLPANLGLFAIGFADRFFLSHLGTLQAVGLYSLGYKFGYLINLLLIQPVNRIWQAQVFEIAKGEDASVVIGKMFTYFSVVVMFAVLGLSILIKEVISLVADPSYLSAYLVVPFIALAGYFRGAYFFFQSGLLIKKKTKYVSYAVLGGVIVNLTTNFFLVTRFSFQGAAWACLLSNGVMAALVYLFSKRILYIHFEWFRLLHVFSLAVLLFLLSCFISTDRLWMLLALKVGVILSYPGLLWVTCLFTREERQQLMSLVGLHS